MTKKLIILTVCIILMLLVGCGKKEEKSSETIYQRAESDVDAVKLGTYYSKTTSAYFWVEDNQVIHYVDENASGTIEYGYVIDDDRLIATSWLKTMNFEILDESSLKLDEDIFYLNNEE